MEPIYLRFLENEPSLVNLTEEGLAFNNKFTKQEIESNKHFLLEEGNIVVQINTNTKYLDCHSERYERPTLHSLTKEKLLSIVTKLLKEDRDIFFNIVGDSDEEEEPLGLEQFKNEEDSEFSEEYANYIIEIINHLDISSIVVKEKGYRLELYTSGVVSFYSYRKGSMTPKMFDTIMYDIVDLYDIKEDFSKLENIKMIEKETVGHPMSQLNVVTDYLLNNKETLPKEVIDALDSGVGKELLILATNFEGRKQYK